MSDLQRQYLDIDQKADEICTVQMILQPTTPKSDRLLVVDGAASATEFVRAFLKNKGVSLFFRLKHPYRKRDTDT